MYHQSCIPCTYVCVCNCLLWILTSKRVPISVSGDGEKDWFTYTNWKNNNNKMKQMCQHDTKVEWRITLTLANSNTKTVIFFIPLIHICPQAPPWTLDWETKQNKTRCVARKIKLMMNIGDNVEKWSAHLKLWGHNRECMIQWNCWQKTMLIRDRLSVKTI